MDIINIDINNINLDNNLMKMIIILLFLSHFWLGILNLKNVKHLKRYKRRINACGVASHRLWDWCVSEDEKKRNRANVY